ncbi:carbonic anhydrase [Candidatus Synechococcus calcipolaris G9]|uniref:Carbonic anhydrase n=1 Tax=Candidatus Synechococcus calcipolaris G9 TaxID=1497997 RepID=A0ABT6EU62_9SYNE|nr:carbonic anhydrase [Candidatus Synechococcus calcipolaris]MDG2989431.1 carbonic anhydrase [Candidatus Synechococcus calcipolaris G9]
MGRLYGSVGRRDFLKFTGLMGAIAAMPWNTRPAWADTADMDMDEDRSLSPDEALNRLMAGNERFMHHTPKYPHQSAKRLHDVAQGQHPFATVLSCADSRVPVELLFDVGVGDLFDIRVAGNVITPEVLGSIEYAAALLGTSLVMVLGHERCGAVTAAVQDKPLPGNINAFVNSIKPALGSKHDQSAQFIETAVVSNVCYQIDQMKQQSPILADLEANGKLKIVGGRYDLDEGDVTLVA